MFPDNIGRERRECPGFKDFIYVNTAVFEQMVLRHVHSTFDVAQMLRIHEKRGYKHIDRQATLKSRYSLFFLSAPSR